MRTTLRAPSPLLLVALIAALCLVTLANVIPDDGEGLTDSRVKRWADDGEGLDDGEGRRKRSAQNVVVSMDLGGGTGVRNFLSRLYASIAIGGKTFDQLGKGGFDTNSTKLENLAKGLAPAIVRLGGTTTQFITFNPDRRPEPLTREAMLRWKATFNATKFWDVPIGKKNWSNFNVTGDQFLEVANFVKRVGWRLMFDFNGLLWREDGSWNPENALLLIRFCEQNDITIDYFELTNEPNSNYFKFNLRYPPDAVATGFRILHDKIENLVSRGILSQRWLATEYVGPGTTSPARHWDAVEYIDEFFNSTDAAVVDGMSAHHYYFDGKDSTLNDFLDVNTFDQMKTLMDNLNNIKKERRLRTPIYLTETGNAFGGGNRYYSSGYASVFIWLDQLGLGALYGAKALCRQNLRSADYSVLDWNNNPNPDYWVTRLYKELIYGRPINITKDAAPELQDPNFRLYAACALSSRAGVTNDDGSERYVDGDVVVYYVYVGSEPKVLDMKFLNNRRRDLYILTGDTSLSRNNYMMSQKIFMNGQELKLNADDTLPKIVPVEDLSKNPITIPPYSVGFIGVHNARSEYCGYVAPAK